jgi:hypothetical protein
MAETMSLKALARQILARECERPSVFPGAPRPIAAALLPAPIDAIAPPARVVTLAGGEPGLDQPCARATRPDRNLGQHISSLLRRVRPVRRLRLRC